MPVIQHTDKHPQTPRILVFDSGVGGLSILQEIRQQYPHCAYFYASDNAAFPYGTQPENTLVDRVDHVIHQLQQCTQADIIVIACNTASTVALPRIRERFSQPIIGVVPAIKPAAAISQSKTIGLLATPGTVARSYTQQLINEFASDCQIISVGSSELVLLAEKKLRGETISPQQLKTIVEPFTDNHDIDTLVLACTHFPLLRDELRRVLPTIKHWIDSGEAIARRVGYWLNESPVLSEVTAAAQQNTVFFTEQSSSIESLAPALQQFSLCNIAIVPNTQIHNAQNTGAK
ncbi:glutamate racemase [Eionea flava]